jgi:hypothetical protein
MPDPDATAMTKRARSVILLVFWLSQLSLDRRSLACYR